MEKNKFERGDNVFLSVQGMKVPCKVKYIRANYGRFDYRLKPISGIADELKESENISDWVSESSLESIRNSS